MNDPVWQSLQTIRSCVERLLRDHGTVVASMARGYEAPKGWTGGMSDPEGSVSWTTVESAGNKRIRSRAGEYQTLSEQAEMLVSMMDGIRAANVAEDTKPLAVADRCDGGAGDWARPECEDIALDLNGKPRSFWCDGRQHQLCHKCYNRYRQWKHRTEEREAS